MDNIINIEDKKKPSQAAAGGSGGGNPPDLERRVDKLEAKFDKMQESMNRIELTLARIEGDIKTKASATEVAEIKGKLSQIPNFWKQLAISIAVAGFMMAILRFGLK